MSNSYFRFKQFTIGQERSAMKVTTDACLFGAWAARRSREAGTGSERVRNILDIGTGTGLLALMYAQQDPSAIVDAIEMDEGAAIQAKENTDASGWKDRIHIIHADTRTFAFTKKYDRIISNPPFYENELKGAGKQKNMAHHNEGLLLKELLVIIRNNLQPDGLFYLLLSYKRNKEIRDLFLKGGVAITRIIFVRPSVGNDYSRILLEGRLGKLEETEILIDEISITGSNKQYTPEFVSLVKDYYLYL